MRTVLTRTVGLAVAVVVVALLLGQLLGQPILFGYVATGSMEPTMDAGDGFIAIPNAVSGPPAEGDVVVFDAVELHGGELTTHRIVEETDEGYITVGDANPFTDQDAAEPPVSDEQVVAHALQVHGEVVTIPSLGSIVVGVTAVTETAVGTIATAAGVTDVFDTNDAGAFLVGSGIALLGFGLLLEVLSPTSRDTRRSRNRPNVVGIGTVVGIVLLVFVTFATASMVIPSGTIAFGVGSATAPSDDPQVAAPGEQIEVEHETENSGYLPVLVVREVHHETVTVSPEWQTVSPRSSETATVAATAPEETGEYTRHVDEHRYVLVTAPSLLVWFHSLHPLVAIAAVNGVLVAAAITIVVVLFGATDLRLRDPVSDVSVLVRLRRKFR
ncbi:S26 family signal peptidase [Natronobacterium gregoryi]|uniref:Peptidase S26B, signal peptidase n=2 Tax=Natronobacterium gregoryi TaxID=44930 RepID=L0AN57_NATGS|nr:S26 family signal peptidase [Natronobacterium gregoryi]AFZ74515.1 signal peptidase I [Natronobacterium gregoryi SP2]ELY72411.1 peptidase S26B, signal peptidase [Natronobacterium gregoryi SP2]PLK21739.1 S26 family signal peptidase [Natronobacterium gregoryi SP2]SFI97768.1 signal peptidase, endoplasmic reticulum-type [Natronobacterium gregoryi]